MKNEMTPERITELALANGFKLKAQPDGSTALNPYVFAFARALLDAKEAEIAALKNNLTRLCINGNRTSSQIAEDWANARTLLAQAVQL